MKWWMALGLGIAGFLGGHAMANAACAQERRAKRRFDEDAERIGRELARREAGRRR